MGVCAAVTAEPQGREYGHRRSRWPALILRMILMSKVLGAGDVEVAALKCIEATLRGMLNVLWAELFPQGVIVALTPQPQAVAYAGREGCWAGC